MWFVQFAKDRHLPVRHTCEQGDQLARYDTFVISGCQAPNIFYRSLNVTPAEKKFLNPGFLFQKWMQFTNGNIHVYVVE